MQMMPNRSWPQRFAPEARAVAVDPGAAAIVTQSLPTFPQFFVVLFCVIAMSVEVQMETSTGIDRVVILRVMQPGGMK